MSAGLESSSVRSSDTSAEFSLMSGSNKKKQEHMVKRDGVLYIHTQRHTDPDSAWSHAAIDPLTSHFTKSAVSSIPVLIHFLLKVCVMYLLRFRG